MKKRIAITTTSFGEFDQVPIKLLEDRGYELFFNTAGRKLKSKETKKICRGCAGIIAGTELYDRQLLTQLPGLKVISRCGVGTENIDIPSAQELGIRICNTPDAPTNAVAELTVGLILSLLRHIPRMDKEMKKGEWKKRMGNLLEGKRVGIIGFGRIGQKVAFLLKPFGVDIAYFDVRKISSPSALPMLSLKALLRWSDIVTLHCGLQSNKTYAISEPQLQVMKNGAWLINASRGEVVDEQALCAHLKKGHLAGAAIDVFSREPYKGALLRSDNVILTPHIGSYAKESRIEMENLAVYNLLKILEGRS
jgi:D-3-phosphoglycerate dehydrogenase